LNREFVAAEIGNAFRYLDIIANDLIFHLSNSTQLRIIQFIFQSAEQSVDVNTSLSSFGLLWNVLSICSTLVMWTIVLTGAAKLIASPRSDVALCAVCIFFSLIVSSAHVLPTEISPDIAKESFIPMVDFPGDAPKEPQQLAFHRFMHCGRSLWGQFKQYKPLSSEFWAKLIAGHELLMTTCFKLEVLIPVLSFSEEAFQCVEISSDFTAQLYDSIHQITVLVISETYQ
jgi:hypothetical protein